MKKCVFLVLLLPPVLFQSCNKKLTISNSTDAVVLHVQNSQNMEWEKSPFYSDSDRKICVVFGYGYNSKDFVSEMENSFALKYGLSESGGRVYPLVYPDDFKMAGKDRISLLSDLLNDVQVQGLILIGAPENTHNAINTLESEYDGQLPFPVFSFFPQDDILGMEYVSDFVLEKSQNTVGNTPNNEEEVVITEEVSALINSAIEYMTYLDSPLPPDENLHKHVQAITGTIGKVSRYVDPESGLQAINHFVLKTNE